MDGRAWLGGKVKLLYSATTKLAYHINETYYRSQHYVWCAPAPRPDPFRIGNPASSDPWDICRNFALEATADDRPRTYIPNNRTGIIRGANARESQGVIDSATRNDIEEMANSASNLAFAPLFLVIPFEEVKLIATRVGVSGAANATSQEFVIDALPRAVFDVWEWKL